jgi:hypothetical protein
MGRIDTVRRREDTTHAAWIDGHAEESMPKKPTIGKPGRVVRLPPRPQPADVMQDILWRLARLERQVHTLSELVRDHAEDADRVVRIVAEDRDVLRRELLRQHQAKVRLRKRTREHEASIGLTSS